MPPSRYRRKRYRGYTRNRLRGNGSYSYMRAQMRGRGDYRSTIRKAAAWIRPHTKGFAARAGGSLGGLLGGAVGTYLAPGIGSGAGAAGGAAAGRWAGRQLAKATGWGDYALTDVDKLLPERIVPSFGPDSIRIRRRECIDATLSASTDFLNRPFALNPGLDLTFPWLSRIAANYEQYRFNGLIFQYLSTTSDAIADTVNLGFGQVIMATDYNAGDAPYVNEVQMLGSMFANCEKPSRDCLHAVECASPDTAQKLYYVRTGAVPQGQDPRLYDLGIFQFATSHMQGNYTGMGQLWVTYDVTFCKAVQNNQIGYDLNTDWFPFTQGFDAPGNSNALQGIAASPDNNIGTAVSVAPGNLGYLVFPETIQSGYYYVQYKLSTDSGGTAGCRCTLTADFNCTIVENFGEIDGFNTGGALFPHMWSGAIFRINGKRARIGFDNYISPGGDVTGDTSGVFVTQINPLPIVDV